MILRGVKGVARRSAASEGSTVLGGRELGSRGSDIVVDVVVLCCCLVMSEDGEW